MSGAMSNQRICFKFSVRNAESAANDSKGKVLGDDFVSQPRIYEE